jgi:serine kinase of HPr protein (carbohydrate metabolism regulator)
MTEDLHQDEHCNPIHATSVVIDGRALLLSGRSGSGKSDLALRLIDRGALLVSDDYTMLENRGGILFAAAPPQIAGKIEIRGIGLVDLACAKAAPVALMLMLDQQADRMPADQMAIIRLEGVEIPTLPLAPFEASAPLKAEAALRLRGLEVTAQ